MTLLLTELLWCTTEAPMIAVGKKMSAMSSRARAEWTPGH